MIGSTRCRPPVRGSSRRGISLTETLVLMVVGSVVMAFGTRLLQQVLRADRGLFRHGEFMRQLSAVEAQLRHDLQAGRAVQWQPAPADAPGGATLRLVTGAGDEVEYRVDQARLTRRVIGSGERAGERMGQRVFRLPAGDSWEIDWEAAVERAIVRAWHRLRERGAGDAAGEPRQEFRISAGLGDGWITGQAGGRP